MIVPALFAEVVNLGMALSLWLNRICRGMFVVNTYSEPELKKFDQWVRKRLDECKGDEDCYEYV